VANPSEEDSNSAKNAVFGSAGIAATFCRLFQRNIQLGVPCAAENSNNNKQNSDCLENESEINS
jgi:hypothetical protein